MNNNYGERRESPKRAQSEYSVKDWDALLEATPLAKPFFNLDDFAENGNEEGPEEDLDDSFNHEITQEVIDEENEGLLRRQKVFRLAAKFIADEYAKFDWVTRISIIGSVARPLWKEVPRFSDFRRQGIALWHECSDLDMAVWVSSVDLLNELRKSRNTGLKTMYEIHPNLIGVAHHQAEIFIFDSNTETYRGRLCTFKQCPRSDKHECLVRDCGKTAYLRKHEGFSLYPDALSNQILLYSRDEK